MLLHIKMFTKFAFYKISRTPTRIKFTSLKHSTCSSIKRIQFSPALKRIIGAGQQWRCAGPCKKLLPASFQIDHIVPLHKSGPNVRENLQALCPTCHAEKSYRELYDGGRNSIPSVAPVEDETDKETQSTSMAVCTTCGVTHSLYFVHMCTVAGC